MKRNNALSELAALTSVVTLAVTIPQAVNAAASSISVLSGFDITSPERLWWVQAEVSFSMQDVQRYLKTEDLYSGAIDGLWGPGTDRGVRELFGKAQAAQGAGQYDKAEEHYRVILAAAEPGWGIEHPDTLAVLTNLAVSLSSQGRFAEAETLERRVLEARERAMGPEHPETLSSMNNLADALSNQGHFAEAEALDRRVLEARERILGRDHPNTLTSMNNLAIRLSNQGRFAEAEALDRRVIEARERVLGAEHPDTAFSMMNLAVNLAEQGRHAEAETFDRRVLEIAERLLGPEHPRTLNILSNLASRLSDQGRFPEAEELDRRALEARERVLGVEHPDTLSSMNNLAIVLADQGRFAEAESLDRRALKARQRVLGAEHPDTLSSMNNLANHIAHQNRFSEAEALHRRVLQARERVLGVEHPETLKSMNDLSVRLAEQGRFSEAEAIVRRVIEVKQRVLGAEHPETFGSITNLVFFLNEQGKSLEALSALELGFAALPAYFALGSSALEAQGELLPLDLADYLSDLSSAAPPDAAGRSFAVQGWLNYSRLDIVMGDLAARRGLDPTSVAELRRLQETREELQGARRAYLDSFNFGKNSDRSAIRARVTAAEKAFAAEIARVQRDIPALAEFQLPSALKAGEAQELLRPGEGLLAFAPSHDVLNAWLVTPDHVEWRRIDLDADALAKSVSDLRAALDYSAEPAGSRPAEGCVLPAGMAGLEDRNFNICTARDLHDLLLGQFDLVGVDELIVVPDGPLEQLPFSLLVTGTDPDGAPHWLIEDVAISYLPTTSSLRALRQDGVSREDIAERLPYLGIAPVNFGDQTAAPGIRGGQYDLPSTEAEVRKISNLLDPGREVVVTGDRASEAFARTTNLARYEVISFATHALLSEEARDLTEGAITEPALLLHPGDGEDGFLTASEAATLRLDADWVLLSACNTAAGDAEDAEGLSGLARAFFFAGAKALMVSHWPVEDRSAMALMTETMKRSASGDVSRAQALREAMLAVMNDPDHDWGHPLFWAPFVIVGESTQ